MPAGRRAYTHPVARPVYVVSQGDARASSKPEKTTNNIPITEGRKDQDQKREKPSDV
jgi:hypothetical protein